MIENKHVFILGCERSGSTWLANILDAHPGVELFMEPFADYAVIFPDIPPRNVSVCDPNETQINGVQTGYEKLLRLKYPLGYRFGRSLNWKRLDAWIIQWVKRIDGRLHRPLPLAVQRYDLLNLHTSKIPVQFQVKKWKKPQLEATKDLRLCFKTGLIAHAFANPLFLIAIRHPGAQIGSIQTLFSKNSLGELRRSLETFIDDIRNQPRFDTYTALMDRFADANDPDILLILWWLIHYEMLFRDLKDQRLTFLPVFHEDISETPAHVASAIFDFIGLDLTPEVHTYLERSSSAERSRPVQSNVDTFRNSSHYYKERIGAVDPELNRKIREITGFHFHSGRMEPPVHAYLERFDEFKI
ncbi:MAG: sulfotransferase [Candidatus Omnitrophota bacterium]